MNIQNTANNYLIASSVLPIFLSRNFKGMFPDIAVLGYGDKLSEVERSLWTRDNSFLSVLFYDVRNSNTETLAADATIIRVVDSPIKIPKGCPAVAVHPGIGMTNSEAFNLWGSGNQWQETLDAFRPLFFAFCDYSEGEHAEALAKLDEIGYVKICPIDTTFFRESYSWTENSGPGWSASIVMDVAH